MLPARKSTPKTLKNDVKILNVYNKYAVPGCALSEI